MGRVLGFFLVKVTQSCPSLWDPMDCSSPCFSVHGILQARILEWAAIPFFWGSSWSWEWTQGSCIAGRLFTFWAIREDILFLSVQFSSVAQSCPTLCDPWIAARQASLSITNSGSSLKLTSIESVMPSSHFILCRPLLLLPPIPPSIRVFSNESTLRMWWPNSSKPGILKEPI